MKLAIIGSRGLNIENLEDYIHFYCDEIVSGGAKGIDKNAEEYARKNNIKLTVFLPDYAHFGKAAPLKRNQQIAEYADIAIAFWDGKSKGTAYTINSFRKLGKNVEVITLQSEN